VHDVLLVKYASYEHVLLFECYISVTVRVCRSGPDFIIKDLPPLSIQYNY